MKLLIVGGGPAALATAIYAARDGHEAHVFEKRPLPLDKPCGEGLQPSGARTLAELGVAVPSWGRMPLSGIRYIDGRVTAEGRFLSGPGLGVRRTALVEGLYERARGLGVVLHQGAAVTGFETDAHGARVDSSEGAFAGDVLIGADGLKSRVRQEAGLAGRSKGPARFGARRHFAMKPWTSFVEVHWTDGAEAYVTPAGPDLVGVAFLWSGPAEKWERMLARFPALLERLAGAAPASPVQGVGPFRQPVRSRVRGETLALVGDAAGYLDPLTGEGLTLGFDCARALVDTLTRGLPLATYERRYRTLSRNYYLMTSLVLLLSQRPRLRRVVMAALSENEDLFSRLLALSAREPGVHWLSLLGLARGVRFKAIWPRERPVQS